MSKLYLMSFVLIIAFINQPLLESKKGLISFPGAEGFGAYATGGRGGAVVEVTNLQDDGTGSLRDALRQYSDQPLTVVFKVAGIIELKSNLRITRSNLTIAGQTAPGDGICLKGNSVIINGASGIKGKNNGNIIIRYLRSRPGNNSKSGSYGIDIENVSNVIIDHCSFSWANEECAAVYDVKNLTLQWCIISEGLHDAGHQKGKRAYGGVWGGQNVSFHHNLIANQKSRTIRFNGSRAHDTLALVDYRNNVIYNWGSENACYGGEVEINGGKSLINVINNYYLPGPATSFTPNFVKFNYNDKRAKGIGNWFISGNVMHNDRKSSINNKHAINLIELPSELTLNILKTESFEIDRYAKLKTQKAARALASVLKEVGAKLPRRDNVDFRIIKSVNQQLNGIKNTERSGIIDSPNEVGGWPKYNSKYQILDKDHDGMADSWEVKMKLNPRKSSDRNKKNSKGYTMLELYLNSIGSC